MREIWLKARVSSNDSCADINGKFCDHLSWHWLDGGKASEEPLCTLFNEKLRQEHEKGRTFYIFCCARCVCAERNEIKR